MLRSGATVVPEIYMPLGYDLKLPVACRGCQHLQLIGRMKPGVTPEQTRAELNSILQQLRREHPNDYDQSSVIAVMPLRDATVGQVKTALWILLAAVGFVLLIACANVAHLAMARVTVRGREMAVRAALGAARGRLLRQLFLESLLLALIGGLAGVALAWCGTSMLTTLGPTELPRAQEIRLDLPVLLFALATSLLTGLLFGMAPAIRASQADPMEAIKDSEHSTQGRARSGYRNALVMLELAMAFVLVMGAGLLGRSLLRLLDVNPGYDPHNVLTAGVYLYGDHYKKPEVEINFYEQAMQRLRATPGFDSAAMVSTLPLANHDRRGLHIQDRPLANESDGPAPDAYAVSPEYFRVMRIPLKRGRLITSSDRMGAPGVALVSESCARAVFPNEDPIGRHIQLGGRDNNKPWLTIVGIVGDVRQYGFDQPSRMEAYIAEAQDVSYGFNIVARTTVDPRQMEASLRQAFASVDGTQPLYSVQPLEVYVALSQSTRRFTLLLLALFGGVALLLAAIGVYGVISYAVSLRTRELGIRMALGAAPKDVLQMVLGQGLRLAGAGLAIGLVASLLLTRFLSSLLFEVRAGDWITAVAVTLTLASVALLANYLPARHAAGVDPAIALRCE
jgi:putative ABC transport system permease protein